MRDWIKRTDWLKRWWGKLGWVFRLAVLGVLLAKVPSSWLEAVGVVALFYVAYALAEIAQEWAVKKRNPPLDGDVIPPVPLIYESPPCKGFSTPAEFATWGPRDVKMRTEELLRAQGFRLEGKGKPDA